MMFRTHIAFAFLVSIVAIKLFSIPNQILFIVITLLASSIADIDHPDSKLGKKLKFISFLFEHRGFFHSVFAVLLFSIVAYFIGKIYFYAVLLGYSSHIAADALTIQGIMPFHPLSRKSIRGFIKTGSFLEALFFIAVVILSAYLII